MYSFSVLENNKYQTSFDRATENPCKISLEDQFSLLLQLMTMLYSEYIYESRDD